MASADFSFVGGGKYNCASTIFATVVGGISNSAQSCFAFVGGGCNNTATGKCGITIVGGRDNLACNDYAVIAGGCSNVASGILSSILGGQCNNTNGYANSHIIGSSITASASDTTFVQALSKTSGTFRISHPDPKKTDTHYLQHSFVESPTAGDNIYRYVVTVKDGVAEIKLPDYFKFLNENPQVWVSPKNGFGIAYGNANEDLTKVIINADLDIDYNVLIIGTRKDKDAITNWK